MKERDDMVERQGEFTAPEEAVATLAWSSEDETDLLRAVAALERTSFASRLGGMVGRHIGVLGDLVPPEVAKLGARAASKALAYALRAALATMRQGSRPASPKWHMAAVAASGAVGGAFGLATLPIELPVSTMLMLRAIAGVAREEGEDLSDPGTSIACIEVFGLGAGTEGDPLGQSSYFAARALMAKSVTEAARYVVQRGIVEETAPVLLRLLGQVSSRFGLVVTQKVIAQTVPIVGAAAGAAVNAAFMEHYHALARGHFIVRRLERHYGAASVRAAYDRLNAAAHASIGSTSDGSAAAPDTLALP